MSYYDKARDLYNMVEQGKLLDAFEKYYHTDVVMVEATGETRKGKEANRQFQVEFMNRIKDVNGSGVYHITSDEKEGTTMGESWMDVTMKDGKRDKMEEVAVQKWKGDQVVYERFYYNMPQQ
jgi:ketosteroid isomerase-like protein